MSRRVVMLTHLVPPDALGGLGRYVRELSEALSRRGHDVTVITKQVDPEHLRREVTADGVTILRDPAPSGGGLAFWARYTGAVSGAVARHLDEMTGNDIVVNGHYSFPSYRLDAGRPFVYTFHAPVWREVFQDSGRSLPAPVVAAGRARVRAIERSVLDAAGAVVTLSDFMAAEARHLTPEVAPRLRLVPGGLDTDRFVPPASRAASPPTVFTARRLVRRTGVGELVAAMPAVLERHPDARLRIAGDGPLRDEITALVVSLGLGASVQLLGRIDDDQLVAEYQRATLAVTPTQELEGFGLSTAEAMACGTPVLVTPVGANPELVRDLGAQHVSADVTPGGLAAGIGGLLAGGALAAEAYRDAALTWSWDAVASRYEELYDEVTAR